jgi:hydroxymethylpyrimidine pyrophosphatase-like HAD family hydrolase
MSQRATRLTAAYWHWVKRKQASSFVCLLLPMYILVRLQVLPLGVSKGAGVSWLLDHLGMDPAGLLALSQK